MTKRRKWLRRTLIILAVLIIGTGIAAWQGLVPLPWNPDPTADELPTEPLLPTVPVQTADTFITDLQVNGKLELRTVREVKAPFDETVAAVAVELGDLVAAGQVLVSLDRQQLSSQLDSEWFELTKTRRALADLVQPEAELAILEAQSELMTAEEELQKLEDGPAAADLSAANVAIQEAQNVLTELQQRNDPNSTKVRQARYALRQAENSVHRAQTAYNAVSWRGDIAALAESSALQSATIALESARTDFEEASKPPTALELQQAQLAITKAQSDYNKLFEAASPAQVEQARVRVAKAEDALKKLNDGPDAQQVQEAEVAVLDALQKFEETRLKLLTGSDLIAPIDGFVTKLSTSQGQVVKEGDAIATVAAASDYKVSLPVGENFILRLTERMPVEMTVDVAPDRLLNGMVTDIARVDSDTLNASNSGGDISGRAQSATYPVTIEVADSPALETVRAGMNVQVTFIGSNQLPPNSWLVPATSIEDQVDDTGTIQILRGEEPEPLQVTLTGITEGEWAVVVSTELQEGDMVVGTVASFLNQSPFGEFGPGGF